MKKIAFIIQRFGNQVQGGPESYCYSVASRLTKHYQVEVLTTKSIDFVKWENEIEEDTEIIDGITVRRFPTEHGRTLTQETYNRAFYGRASREDGEAFLKDQGPYCPSLIDFVRENAYKYDAFILMTYAYYPTVFSSFEVGQKAIFIPTAHNEINLHQAIYKDVFSCVAGLYYLTPEEKNLVERLFDVKDKICNTGHGGAGITVPEKIVPQNFREKYHLGSGDYVLYAGRIEENKGFPSLFSYFEEFKKQCTEFQELKLVLLGKSLVPIPQRDDIVSLGYVSEQDKYEAMTGALALIQPSAYESLSIVLLEALAVGTPVLVNGESAVLKRHCLRSGAGLFFHNCFEFARALAYVCSHKEERQIMGKNGIAYIERFYQWDDILKEMRRVIDAVIEKNKSCGDAEELDNNVFSALQGCVSDSQKACMAANTFFANSVSNRDNMNTQEGVERLLSTTFKGFSEYITSFSDSLNSAQAFCDKVEKIKGAKSSSFSSYVDTFHEFLRSRELCDCARDSWTALIKHAEDLKAKGIPFEGEEAKNMVNAVQKLTDYADQLNPYLHRLRPSLKELEVKYPKSEKQKKLLDRK